MDFYYRKLMGNGAIATKFRLNGNVPMGIQKQSNMREQHFRLNEAENGEEQKSGLDSGEGARARGHGRISKEYHHHHQHHHDALNLGIVFAINGKEHGIETPKTHHPNNCNRCYRLKKKCLREYPQCNNCGKTGNSCEYTTRSNKRRKRSETSQPEVYDLVATNTKNDKQVVAHKLVSISSLLSSDTSENILAEPRRVPKKIPSAVLSTTGRREQPRDKLLHNKLLANGLKPSSETNLKEEFINIKALPNKLSSKFADNYFENYAHKYPFVNRPEAMARINNIDFNSESIVNLDIYLLLSIGCLIDDSKYLHNISKNQYQQYFGDKGIESIVDVLNFNSSDKIDTLKLLLLLTIHSITNMNEQLCWTLTGVMNRMVVEHDLYKQPCTVEEERIFWSIFNIDKELSFLLDKPSQLPCRQKEPTATLYEDENIELITQEIRYYQLQDTLLGIHLSEQRKDGDLVEISKALEKWRISTSSVVHKTYSESPLLQDIKSVVDLNYYYLLIEIDQLSTSESLQFPLHFLSNSFSMIISEAEFDTKEKHYRKHTLSSSLFWFKRLFKVVKYGVNSLVTLLSSDHNKLELSIKMSEFNGNLQLTLNLLKYISGKLDLSIVTGNAIKDTISRTLTNLNNLNSKLNNFNIMTSDDIERTTLIQQLNDIRI